MSTFRKEVTFLSTVLEGGQLVEKEVSKIATFKELDRTDPTQHKLHFKILSLYQSRTKEEGELIVDGKKQITLDSDVLYDITTKSIRALLVPDEKPEGHHGHSAIFLDTDKAEFLRDSMAILDFSLWFLENHLSPFFIRSKEK